MNAPAPDAYSGRVMLSSVMEGFQAERAALAAIISEVGLIPWWAEDPPNEFREVSPAELSFAMARQCDLYLLVIFPRYGSQALSASRLSVTHEEFRQARAAHPRAVRAFVLKAAITQAETPDFQAFIEEVKGFQRGQWTAIVENETELREAVRTTLERWQREGQLGRDIYIQAVQTEYARFLNPATGQEMKYSATVQLKLRVQLTPTRERPEWEEQETGQRQDGSRPATSSTFNRSRSERERDKERERLRAVTQAPPEVATALLTQHQRLVILGDVGSGKSTLLKRLAHDGAAAYQRGQDARLPILVTATQLGALAQQHSSEPLAEVVGRVKEEETRTEALRPTIRSAISNALADGQALLLIDGLDEATAAEQAAVLSLLGQIGSNWAVLASRPAAYRGQPVGWRVADLLPLGGTQQRELVLQVFHLEHQSDKPPPTEVALEEEAGELETALRERRTDLAAWAGNPLLLTLIAVQFVRDHHLPENRAHIYEFAIEDLQRQRPTSARRYLTTGQLQRLLQTLSLRMQEALRRSATVAEVRDTYLREELLTEFPDHSLRTAVALEVLLRSGVLQADRTTDEQAHGVVEQEFARDQESYSFVHLSFREYLTACSIADRPTAERRDLARRHALHGAWEQVFLLLVNRLDASGPAQKADELVSTLLSADQQNIPALSGKDPTHLALRLASKCALTRGKPTHDLVMDKLRAAWWSLWRAEEQRHRSITEVFVMFPDNSSDKNDLDLYLQVPTLLSDGIPFLLTELSPERQFPRSRWWAIGIYITLSALALLLLVGPLTAGDSFLANSDWGRWLDTVLALLPFMMFITLAALRLYGIGVRTSIVRNSLLVEALPRVDLWASGQSENMAIEFLQRRLGDRSWRLRQAAVEALGQTGDARAVEPLVGRLGDTNWAVRQAAVDALGLLKDVSLEPLIRHLGDAYRDVRAETVEALGKVGDTRAVEPLLGLLDDSDFSVRQAAIKALGQLEDTRAVEPLLRCLHDGDSSVREATVETLGKLGDKRAVEPLLERLRNDNLGTGAVVEALGQLGDARAVKPLLELLRLELLRNDYSGLQYRARRALEQLGDAAVEPLLGLLDDTNPDVRANAVEVLGKLGDVRAVKPLLMLLRDDDERVRRNAIEALGQLGDERAVDPLLRCLSENDCSERDATAEALGQLGDARAVEPLLRLLSDNDWSLRPAIRALRQLDVRAVRLFLEWLHDDNWGVRRDAVAALGQLGDERAVEPLLRYLGDHDNGVRQQTAAALGQLGDARAVEPLLRVLRFTNRGVRDSTLDLRKLVVEALGRLGDERAAQAVVRSVRRQPWWWAIVPLSLIHGITDWPLYVAIVLAQASILVPHTAVAPLIGFFVVFYIGTFVASAFISIGTRAQTSSLDTAEEIIRLQLIDTKGRLTPPIAAID